MNTLELLLAHPFVQRLGWALFHSLWQAAVVAVLLAVALGLMRKASANARYLTACAGLLVIAVMPIVTMFVIDVPEAPVAWMEAEVPFMAEVPEATPDLAPISDAPEGAISVPLIAEATPPPSEPLWPAFLGAVEVSLPYLVVAWLFGVFSLSLWHLGGWAQLRRLKRRMIAPVAEELKHQADRMAETFGIRRVVQVVQSALVEVPTLVGWIKPVILLPASALSGLTPEQLEAILAHELAHVRRHDYLVNLLQTVIEILGFYHPTVWWISRRIRVERENCCDDLAAAYAGDRQLYARALATMEELRGPHGVALAVSGGSLVSRIRRLLGREQEGTRISGWVPATVVALSVTAVALWAIFPARGSADANSKSVDPRAVYGESLSPEEVAARFAQIKRTQVQDVAQREGVEVSREVEAILDAIESNDWTTASNLWNAVWSAAQAVDGAGDNVFQYVYSQPFSEAYHFFEQVQQWDPHVLTAYANQMLSTMPPASVYFGGTDPGRFVVTAYKGHCRRRGGCVRDGDRTVRRQR